MTLTPELVKAARQLLGWSQADLGARLGVSATVIADFERNGTLALSVGPRDISTELEAAGIEFIKDESDRVSVTLNGRGRIEPVAV